MKKTTLCALLLAGYLLTSGQQKVFEESMEPADAEKIEAHGSVDSRSGKILLSLTARHTLRQYRLPADSSAGPATLLSSLAYEGKESRYVGSITLPDGIETCIADKRYSLLRFFHSGSADQQARPADSLPIPADEQFFTGFYQQEIFYVLTVQPATGNLLIHRRRPGGSNDVLEKMISMKDWGKFRWGSAWSNSHINDLPHLIRTVRMVQEDDSPPPPLTTLLATTKCYIRPGLVYLTFDNTRLVTHVLEIPLDERPCRLLQFNPEEWYHKEVPPGFSNGNSFILDSTLITAAIIHHQPWLAFFDLHSGQLIRSYAPNEKGNTSFPRSPIWQVGDFWKKNRVHPISMEDFAKNSFDFWTLGVRARKLDDQNVELEIGTLYNHESFGQMMLLLAEASPAALGMSTVLIVGQSVKPMFFYSQFTNGAFTSNPYKELTDKSELIDTFANSLNVSRKKMSGFQWGEDYWLAWYDEEQRKYLIYKF